MSLQVCRIDLGEEIGMSYVGSCLTTAIELWNHAIDMLEEKMNQPESVLQVLDAGDCDNLTEQQLHDAMETVRSTVASHKKILLRSKNVDNLEFFGQYSECFLFS